MKARAFVLVLPALMLTAGCDAPARPVAPSTTQPAGEALQLQGWVNDAAGVLADDVEARLAARLQALQDRTGHQLVVATVPSLGGEEIDAYSLALARRWRLGRKASNDGVLVLVAPNERKVRIEVGTGLETTLTDATCATIIREDMIPAFRTGDLPGGLERGIEKLVQKLG